MNKGDNMNNFIGIFDSGIGGLSVLESIREFLPYENMKERSIFSKIKQTCILLALLTTTICQAQNVSNLPIPAPLPARSPHRTGKLSSHIPENDRRNTPARYPSPH